MAHERRLFLLLLFIWITLTCSARLGLSTQCCPANIAWISIDYDELFELPSVQGGGWPNQPSGDFFAP